MPTNCDRVEGPRYDGFTYNNVIQENNRQISGCCKSFPSPPILQF